MKHTQADPQWGRLLDSRKHKKQADERTSKYTHKRTLKWTTRGNFEMLNIYKWTNEWIYSQSNIGNKITVRHKQHEDNMDEFTERRDDGRNPIDNNISL